MKPTACAPARLPLLLCLSLAALALALSGCGGGSVSSGRDTTSGAATTTATSAATADRAPIGASAGGCQSQLGGFLGALETLRRKLKVGLSYEQYVAEVGTIRAAYRRLPVNRLSLGCLIETGAPAERAFNQYIAAANAWGECLAEAGCRAATIETSLQRKWNLASHFIPES